MAQHENKTGSGFNVERVARLAETAAVSAAVARLHVGTPDAAAVVHACGLVSNFGHAHPRDIAYFAAAVVVRLHGLRAQYSVLCRVAVGGAS